MKKRINGIICLLTLCILLSMLPVTAQASGMSPFGGSLAWSYDNGTLTISGDGAIPDYSSGNYPPWHEDSVEIRKIVILEGVTGIGDEAFSGCLDLAQIEIPDSVTRIGAFAFSKNYSLKSITIPASVTDIGDGAFSFCTCLDEILVDRDNPSYCSDASGVLYNKNKTVLILAPKLHGAYSIPDGVSRIENYAFSENQGLTDISIPDSVTSIGNLAFERCWGLTDITLPDSLTELGDWAFSECAALTSIHLPDSTATIGNGAFRLCLALQSISLPASITKIEDGAFSSCDALRDIYYDGTQKQWDKIEIGDENNALLGAALHCNKATAAKNRQNNKRLTQVNEYDSEGKLQAEHKFSYSDDGLLSEITATHDGEELYDHPTTFTYDEEGRILVYKGKEEDNHINYIYNEAGHLITTETSYGSDSYEYDDQGRRIKKTNNYGYGAYTTEYFYDQKGRMIQAIEEHEFFYPQPVGDGEFAIPENEIVYYSYTYDDNDRIQEESVDRADYVSKYIHEYQYAPFDVVHTYIDDVYCGSNAVIRDSFGNSLYEFILTTKGAEDPRAEEPQFSTDEDGYLTRIVGTAFIMGEDFPTEETTQCSFAFIYEPYGNKQETDEQLDEGNNKMPSKDEDKPTEKGDKTGKSPQIKIEEDSQLLPDTEVNVITGTIDSEQLDQLKKNDPELHEAVSNGVTYTYDISLMRNGKETQPDGPVTVYIPLPEDLRSLAATGKARLYRYDADGTLAEIDAELKDGTFSFMTDHLDTYAIVGYDPESGAAGGLSKIGIIAIIGIVLVIATGIVITILILRKKEIFDSSNVNVQ